MVPTGTPNKGSVLRLQKKSRKIRLSRVNEDGTTETMVTHRSKSSHDISYSPSELPSAETNEIWLENATKPVEYYSKCLIVLTKFPYFQFFRYFSLLSHLFLLCPPPCFFIPFHSIISLFSLLSLLLSSLLSLVVPPSPPPLVLIFTITSSVHLL